MATSSVSKSRPAALHTYDPRKYRDRDRSHRGTEQQAQDLIHFIDQAEAEHGIWETNIFGKTVEQLVDDGITTKVASIGEESQLKLQDTMQKIVNDSNGGMVCIII